MSRSHALFSLLLSRSLRVLLSCCCVSALGACSLVHQNIFGEGDEEEVESNLLDVAPLLASASQNPRDPARASLGLPALRQPTLPAPPLQLTREVKREMRSLLRGDAYCIRVSLERRNQVLKVVRQIFEDEGVPHDLMNLAIIESRFSGEARSRSGAVGVWQFTRGTAKVYGLKVDGKLDQRKDIILSTLAAARFLRDLYNQFGDWYLALAAYNAGPGAVQRAMLSSRNSSFWALSRSGQLSRQTRDFVPRFIAASIIVKTAEKYGLEDLPTHVVRHLEHYGASLDIDVAELKGNATEIFSE